MPSPHHAAEPFSLTPVPAPHAAAPPTMALYLQEAGDTAPISVNDLHQGQLGDCFLIAPIGEIALHNPNAISGMIHANGNGTDTVRLYLAANGRLPGYGTTAFRAVNVTVSEQFAGYTVNNGATQDVVGNQKEIWPQVLEKAVATLDGGYGAIANGGYPVSAMEELTGHAATSMMGYNLTLSALQGFMAAGDLITMDTPARSGLPDNLVGGHSYMFEKLTTTGGKAMVQLGNPWGFDQPAAIPFTQLAAGIAQVDIGRLA